MSRVGDLLAGDRHAFGPVADELTLRNYIDDGTEDQWGDEDIAQHPDSPVTVEGVVTAREDFTSVEETGTQTDKVSQIYVPADEFVTTGGETWNGTEVPYGTEIEDADGTVYTAVEVTTPGNGWSEIIGRAED